MNASCHLERQPSVGVEDWSIVDMIAGSLPKHDYAWRPTSQAVM